MPSIFEKYHLKQVINTSGRMTALGVSTPRPEVVEAAMAGMNQYFEMKDLVNKTGEYIAKLLDVEGATVVSCASAGDCPVGSGGAGERQRLAAGESARYAD